MFYLFIHSSPSSFLIISPYITLGNDYYDGGIELAPTLIIGTWWIALEGIKYILKRWHIHNPSELFSLFSGDLHKKWRDSKVQNPLHSNSVRVDELMREDSMKSNSERKTGGIGVLEIEEEGGESRKL